MDVSESNVLVAVLARLIPGDETSPGAVEAGVVPFVVQELAGPFAAARSAVEAGLRSLDAGARSAYGHRFAELAADEQDRLLSAVEAEPFFEMLLQLSIDGFLGDPRHGGNRESLGWRVVGYPGVLMAPTEDDQRIGTRIPFTGTTVADWLAR